MTTTSDRVATLRSDYLRTLDESIDGEHAAVAVFLAYTEITGQAKFQRHVAGVGISWDDVLEEDWSETQDFLVRTAAALWSRQPTPVDMSRLCDLDHVQYRLFRDMIEARFTGRVPAT